MYTNIQKYSGDFRNVLDKEFTTSKNVTVASGYASLDVINAFEKPFVDWYSEKIADELKYTESTSEILKVAEEKIKYYKTQANGK